MNAATGQGAPAGALSLGLLSCGGEGWIGGVYYLLNLSRALRLLPPEEAPRLTLVLLPGTEEDRFRDWAGRGEILDCRAASPAVARARKLSPFLKRVIGAGLLTFSPGRRWKRRLEERAYARVGERVRAGGLQLLFPAPDSLGPDFPVPWLPWAWDFQHKHLPEFFSRAQLRERDEVFARMAREARLVVVSSQTALEDFARYYPGARPRLRVLRFVSLPAPDWLAGSPAAARAKYNLPERYFALPNQFWVHKNHRVVFEAWRLLKARGFRGHLVCTGQTADPRRPGHFPALLAFLKEHALEGEVRCLGLLPRGEQIQILRGALAVIQPSLFEGWSTVVEDARTLGKPLLLSALAVHREQAPPEGRFFDPRSAEELAELVARADEELRPGPEAEAEARAGEAACRAGEAYARTFLGIARETLAAAGPSSGRGEV